MSSCFLILHGLKEIDTFTIDKKDVAIKEAIQKLILLS
jgi:hypothetical protein